MASKALVAVPVTKAIILFTVAGSAMFRMDMRRGDIEQVGDIAKMIISLPWCYSGFIELMTGSSLFVTMRHIEKVKGSRKFGAYLFISSGISLFLHLLLYKLTLTQSLRYIPCGPHSLIASLIVQYFMEIPSSQSMISEKFHVYVIALYYFFITGSWASALIGLVGGLIVSSTRLPFHSMKLPKMMVSVLSSITGWFDPVPPQELTPGEIMAELHGQSLADGPYQDQLLPDGRGGIRRRNRQADPELQAAIQQSLAAGQPGGLPQAPPSVSAASVQQLVDMGFNEGASRTALQQCGGSIEDAVAILSSQ
eukprot:TRINITY_DN4134_c1_g4_i1.p1 TRINITY_DN4134_c1_g4~~TRINITY_DN4134_c1_g4_i1.p1  ORF type:complete len:309 (+),score=25.72 TRINITY_DN4134_c1_g4_i1:40-966(+)